MFCLKIVLKIFAKFAKSQQYIKKRLQHRCFPVNLKKFLKTLVLQNICQRLLLQSVLNFYENQMILRFTENWQQVTTNYQKDSRFFIHVLLVRYFIKISKLIKQSTGEYHQQMKNTSAIQNLLFHAFTTTYLLSQKIYWNNLKNR